MPAMELDEITKLIIERCKKHRCSTFGIQDIKVVLTEHARQSNPSASASALAISNESLDTFKSSIATASGLIFVNKPMERNLGRERAALSLRNSVSMVHVVANAELIIGPEGIPIPNDAPAGVIWLRDMFSKAHGGVVVTANPPALKINTDDSKLFFFMAIGYSKEDENEVMVGLAKDKALGGQYSFHRKSRGSGSRFNGILFRATVTTSAGGYMAPIVLCVDGFTENEIPEDLNPEGFVVLEIPGLCVGGDTDARNGNIGYVVLLRNEKGVMARYFEWYDINIREPFADTLRVSVCGMSPQLTSKPPIKFRASLSHDGGTEQATANVKESRLAAHAGKRNECLKVAANASLIQQELDLAKKGFRCAKAKLKVLSKSDITANAIEVGIKAVLAVAKRKTGEGARGLNLPYSTEKNIIEGIKRMPPVYGSSYTSPDITESYVMNGRIDSKYKSFPDGKVMLETIKRDIEPEEYDAVDNSFAEMNQEAFRRGMVSETLFNKHGFKLDATADGIEEEREFGISQERRQRWKSYSHPSQIESRKKHAERTREKANLARRKDDVEINQALQLNLAAETMLHESAGRNTEQTGGNARRLLSNAPIDSFGPPSLQIKHLRAFIQVRETEGVRRKASFSFDRVRGTINEVKAAIDAKEKGEAYDEAQFETWIYIAWSMRTKAVIMKPPAEPSDDNNDENVGILIMPNPVRALVRTQPSVPTDMAAWVEEANKSFDCVNFANPCDEAVHRCAFLNPLLHSRFIQRIDESLPEEKRSHYTMKFCADNMPRMCSMALLAGNVIPNLADADESSCLLLPPYEAKLEDARSPEFKARQGVYAYWDEVKKRWIRVGRVYGDKRKRNFGVRDKEHIKGSLHLDPDSIESLFYLLYADDSMDIPKEIRKAGGKFHDLKMHVLWSLSEYGINSVVKEVDGLFHWDDEVLEGLRKSKAYKGDMKKKKIAMVIYLIEFVYSLLLSPDDNVSLNPGFEAFLRVINHGKQIWLADYDEEEGNGNNDDD